MAEGEKPQSQKQDFEQENERSLEQTELALPLSYFTWQLDIYTHTAQDKDLD